jgi:hypothetical protein
VTYSRGTNGSISARRLDAKSIGYGQWAPLAELEAAAAMLVAATQAGKWGSRSSSRAIELSWPSRGRWNTTRKCWNITTSRLPFRWITRAPKDAISELSTHRTSLSCVRLRQDGRSARQRKNCTGCQEAVPTVTVRTGEAGTARPEKGTPADLGCATDFGHRLRSTG